MTESSPDQSLHMATVFQTFYVSRASTPFDTAAVQTILHASRRNNARADVTGCLLFSGRCFAQVIEGREQDVKALAARIAGDARHDDVRFLCESRRPEREYANWSMGYLHDLNLEDDLEMLLVLPGSSATVVADVLERMRPDPVMGALR